MPLYFLLGTLNENGQSMLLNNPDLVIDAIKDCDCDEAQILGKYFVLGRCDYVMLIEADDNEAVGKLAICLLYTSPSPRDGLLSRMPSSA